MTRQRIQVAGTVSYDYLVYPMRASDNDEEDGRRNVMQMVVCPGSADLVAQLLTAAAPRWNLDVLGPALRPPVSNSLKHNASSVVDLRVSEHASRLPDFKVTSVRHIGKLPIWHSPSSEKSVESDTSKVIVTGSGDAFQDVEPALDFLQQTRPRYVIHHMTRPLASGRLWDIIRNGPLVRGEVPDPDHLAVIIDADDLRAEGISLSSSLSWEATAEDFVRNLGANGRLDTLVTCPNLIVRFGNAAVIHHRGREAVNPKLYFFPRDIENSANDMIGSALAFTAGFAIEFPETEKGIRLGMSASRSLSERGFVPNKEDGSPEYPVESIIDDLVCKQQPPVSVVNIPSTKISSGEHFNIFDALTGDPGEVARRIVTHGADRVLARCPIRRFGALQSLERADQESLGSIVDIVEERLNAGYTSPTCIGISGPIGSGKKFVAANLAESIGTARLVRNLSYNARLMKSDDLLDACHVIRDNAAKDFITVVSFENFEAVLRPENPLLPEFLSVMRDAIFHDHGHRRTLGQCLLFFLVNRDISAMDVVPTPTVSDFNGRNVVDDSVLLDRLHGVVQLSGPNQKDPHDRMFCVRRAMMLRRLLEEKHPHLASPSGVITIDDAVLHALLFVPSYKYGLRSLEKIVSTSRLSGRAKFDVAALPPEEQIQLHVDGRTFMSFLRSPKLPPTLREKLAEGLFEAYKKQRECMCKTDEERQELLTDRSMVDWDELAGELKESTRAQADDIPRKLRAVNCFMLNEDRSDPLVHIPEFSTEDLDMLSEMEHERFNAERLQRQWRMGARNSKQRTTPFIIPWRDLSQEWRDVDRVMVECVPRVLAESGYRIYRMKEEVN